MRRQPYSNSRAHGLARSCDPCRASGRILRVPAWVATVCLIATPVAFSGDWYVDTNAPNCPSGTGGPTDPFCRITDALAVAIDGDTIHVAPGRYPENLVVDTDVFLVGTAGATSTIVDGSDFGTVVEVAFGTNVAIDGLTIQNGNAHYGGGIHVAAVANVLLSRSIVQGNRADAHSSDRGGGISVEQGTVSVDDCSILDNSADDLGGGIYNDRGTVVISNSVISHNSAGVRSSPGDGSGGGIGNDFGAVTLTNSTLSLNHAGISQYPGSDGGGGSIFTYEGSFAIDNCLITDSFVDRGGGGGVYSEYTDLTITRSDIQFNRSGGGGGVWITAGTSVTIEQSTISNNQAFAISNLYGIGGSGGGIFVFDADVVMTGCNVHSNGGKEGAGVGVWSAGHLTMTRCTVSGNLADVNPQYDEGGGIYSEGTLTLTGCKIVENEAICSTYPDGGGIFSSGTTTLANCTVAGNKVRRLDGRLVGVGGGVSVDPARGSFTSDHSVIAGNAGGTNDIAGTIDSKGYNCIGDTAGGTITGDPTGNLLDVDPRFENRLAGDYSLSATSPCVDAGDPALVPGGMDLSGTPRLLDGDFDRQMVVDMGALEFDHVHLAVTGSATAGGMLTFTTTGQAGLPLFMFIGLGQSELLFPRYGALFIDVSQPWFMVPWGTIPDTVSIVVGPSVPFPVTIHLQELAIDTAARTGNFGNVVTLTLE